MKRNIGTKDRVVRLSITAVMVFLYMNFTLPDAWNYIFLVVGSFLLITAGLGICPIYLWFGINTVHHLKK